MELSWIQKHTLLYLIRSRTATVKDLRPDEVEANLFSYHIHGLVTAGFITKIARGTYTLTTQGEKFVGQLSTATNAIVENVKTVILYWAEDSGKTLLLKWSRQPYMGWLTLPYNRVPFGKSLQQAVEDGLREKIGQDGLATDYVASALIRIECEGTLISHMNALVYNVDTTKLPKEFVGRNGHLTWTDKMNNRSVMRGIDDFLIQLREGKRLIESTWDYDRERTHK